MHDIYILFFSKKLLLNSAKTCFILNTHQTESKQCATGNKESLFTLLRQFGTHHACDIRLAVPEVINISSSQLVSGDWIASA